MLLMLRKKAIIIIIILGVLAAAFTGLYFTAKRMLPSLVKEKLINSLSGITQGKVTLSNVRINILKGIVIEGLVIHDKDDPSIELANLKEASAGFFLLPLLKDKKIIIPEIKVNSLNINLVRNKDKSFNISYIIERLKQPQTVTGQKPFSILILQTRLNECNINLIDNVFDKPGQVNLNLQRITLRMGVKKLAFDGKLRLTKDSKTTNAAIKAAYEYTPERLTAHLSLDTLELNTFIEYLNDLPIKIETGAFDDIKIDTVMEGDVIMAKADLNFDRLIAGYDVYKIKNAKGRFSATLHGLKNDLKNLSGQGKLAIDNVLLDYNGEFKASANIEKTTLDYNYSPDQVNNYNQI